jgi:WD40 repeat protein
MTDNSSLITHHSSLPFYVTGGTLSRDALSYVVRQADHDLYESLLQGRFCYVLTSRQMGKSSLMVRTAARLREAGVGVVLLDLTAIGQNLTAEQWYSGLLAEMGQQLELDDELEEFWDAHPKLGPLQRWMQAIRQILLPRYPGHVTFFVDEIDAVRSLPFSTDEFFAAIREFYNRRTEDEGLRRLTFCLLGVAAPSDLVRDTRTTPFNIGERIELHDFTEAESMQLAQGLGCDAVLAATLLHRIIYWTGGHPYLTQRLCESLVAAKRQSAGYKPQSVDRLCHELFLTHQAQERDDNLLFVRERMLRSEVDLAGLLTLYASVQARKRVPDDVANPMNTVLRLSGITRVDDGLLRIRNRIYGAVFGREWVHENMPDAELRRQRVAYRRGLLRAAAIGALIIAAISGLALTAIRQRNRAEQQEQSNRRLLYSAQMNLAARDWQDSSITHMRDLLALQAPQPGQTDLRGFEWYLLWALAHPDRQTLPLSGSFQCIVFSPDLKMFATGEEADVKLWDLATGNQVRSLKEAGLQGVIEFSPDGKLLAACSADNSIRLWDLTAGRELRRFTGHTQFINCLLFSRDGKNLASAGLDQTARLWEVETGNLLATLKGHTKTINSVTFSPDARRAVTASEDETVKIWDVATGKELMTLKEHPAKGNTNAPMMFRAAFSLDGRRVLAAGNFPSIAVWEATTGQPLPALEGHGSWIVSLAFSRDGKLMATGSGDRTIRLWDANAWRFLKSFTGHGNQVSELTFSRDARSLASASSDKTIKLWDVDATPNPLERGEVRLASFAPDGRKLASAHGDDMQLWNTDTWQVIATFKGRWSGSTERRTIGITSLAYSRDGKILATGSEDKTARIWDVATGRERLVLEGHSDKIWAVAFSPDGKLLATASEDKTVRLWDVTTGQELAKLEGHGAGVWGIAFSPDGRLLASASWDTNTKLWDVVARRELATLKGHISEVYAVAFSPDGKILATGGADSMIKFWDIASRKELSTLKGHAGIILALAFSPDGKRLATAGQDFTVRLWDVATGQELAAFRRHTDSIQSVTFSPDGKTLVSAGNDGRLNVWRAASEQEVQARGK